MVKAVFEVSRGFSFHRVLPLFWVLLWGLSMGAQAATKSELDVKVNATLQVLYEKFPESREMVRRSFGVLVFPEIAKAGFFVGGEYGEGALLKDGFAVGYYSAAGGSIGIQFGVQVRSQVVLFMSQASFESFRTGRGWEVGVDGSVAVATEGAGGKLDTKSINQPVVAFIFGNKGLMAGVSLEGSKFTPIQKQ
ncbi:MAG: hypothetical protein IPM37_23775 [Hahellaceae bacterium]|nr:hypothetical protein [Hahellaceae bacterium]